MISRLLDDRFALPGTRRRFGLDPIIGLVPIVGDAIPAAMALWLIAEAARFRLPRVVVARMIANVVIDFLIGLVPFIGDLFDFASKPSARNLVLFRRYANDPDAGTADQRRFFIGVALVVVGLGWIALTLVGWLESIEIPLPGG